MTKNLMSIDGLTHWNIVSIDEIKSPKSGSIAIGPFGSRMKSNSYTEYGVPIIRGNNISDTKVFTGEFVFISEEMADQLKSSNVQANDLVFPHRGAIGEVGIVPKDSLSRYMLSSSLMKLTCNTELVEPLYLFYYFRSPYGRHELLKNASTVGTPGIGTPLATLRTLKVPLPPLPIQQRIAEILGRLDDKIEVNRRINRTLESMAQALYQHWFVDFGPFQDGEFVESELGPIPVGWETDKLGNQIEAVRGLSYKGQFLAENAGLPMHNLNSVYEGGGYKYGGIKFYTGDYKDRHVVYPGDLIVANTEQGFDYLLIGCPAIVPRHFGDMGIFSHHIYRVRPLPSSPLTSHYLYLWLRLPRFRDMVTGFANGTTVNMLPVEGLQWPELVIPPQEIVERFDRIIKPYMAQIENNYEENVKLAAIRDYLLPKLLSGEVPVLVGEEMVA